MSKPDTLFPIYKNKIFLKDESFLSKSINPDSEIIEKDYHYEMENSILTKNTNSGTRIGRKTSKLDKIPASLIYSVSLKNKNFLDAFLKEEEKENDLKKLSELIKKNDKKPEMSILQFPIQLDHKAKKEDLPSSFLGMDEIEKNNSRILNSQNQSLSLPKLHRKYEIIDSTKAFFAGEKKQVSSSTKSKAKMTLDLDTIHNRNVYNDISQIFKELRHISFRSMEKNVQREKKEISKLPPIRSYPSVKVKKISYKLAKELDDLDSKEGTHVKSATPSLINSPTKVGSGKENVYRVHWSQRELTTWKPEVRESSSFILDANKGYLYGGLGTHIMSDVVCFDFQNFTWNKMQDGGDRYNFGKYGHTAVRYKKKMIVFGGGTAYQSGLRQKECLGEVRVLNLDDLRWSWVKCGGDIINPRRSHASEIIGKNMIVHGGLNYKGSVLGDLWLFDMVLYRWSQASITTSMPNLAFHAVSSVYYPQRTRLECYKGIDRKIAENNSDMIKHEGIYFFGGKNESFEAVNDLIILEIHCNPFRWFRPETYGKLPIGRYGLTLNFCPQFGILIAFGGKNDKHPNKPFSNDMNILMLNNMNWLKVKIFGTNYVNPRGFHNSTLIGSELFIFGGYNSNGYVNNEMNVVELDAKNVRSLLNVEKEKKMIRHLQEQLLREKMEKNMKSKHRSKYFQSELKRQNGEFTETFGTEENDNNVWNDSFEEDQEDQTIAKHGRKEAQILEPNLYEIIDENKPTQKVEDKWKRVVERLDYKNFYSHVTMNDKH